MSFGDRHFYEFGTYRIDTVERHLLRANQPVPLTPKAYETLLALVGNAGHALDKDELLRRVWPDTFVEEGSLTRNISALRATLGEADGPFIETIPRRGYRFVAPVRELHVPAESVIVEEHTVSQTVIEETETPARRWLSLPMAAGAIALLLLAAIVYFATGRTARPAVRSLAVLPLKSLHKDADAAHIELGIADGIIAKVSQISGLTVRPTSAIRKYVDANADPLQAARELKVDAVLDGTLQREGDRLRVSLNLLPAAGGASLWAQTFDVRYNDVFDVEDEVAQRVAAQLRLVSGTTRPTRQTRDHPRNPEAYEHYLRGLYSYEMRNVSGASRPAIEAAIGRFTKATELDPAFAEAHAQLAICYTGLMNFYQPDGSMAAAARRAASQAYALDPDLPELRVFRAWMFWYRRYQVDEAIRELRGSAAQNFSAAHSLLGNLYSHAGLVPLAMREFRRALEIDPTNALHLDRLAAAHVWAGQYDEAGSVYRQVLAIEPRERSSLMFSAVPFLYARQFQEARRILQESRDLAPQNPIAPSYLALLDAMEGDSQKAEAAVPSLAKASELLLHGHHAFYAFAGICALQGKSAEAVRWLRKAAENGMPNYPLFTRDPNFDRIRSSAEFVEFMATLKPRWEAMEREFR